MSLSYHHKGFLLCLQAEEIGNKLLQSKTMRGHTYSFFHTAASGTKPLFVLQVHTSIRQQPIKNKMVDKDFK